MNNMHKTLSIKNSMLYVALTAVVCLALLALPATSASAADHDNALSPTTTDTTTQAEPNVNENTLKCSGNLDPIHIGGDDACKDENDLAGGRLGETIKVVLNIFSWIIGITSVIMIVFAGFKYVTSQGGDGVGAARNTIIYAVIGLVVVALAQTIVQFVLSKI